MLTSYVPLQLQHEVEPRLPARSHVGGPLSLAHLHQEARERSRLFRSHHPAWRSLSGTRVPLHPSVYCSGLQVCACLGTFVNYLIVILYVHKIILEFI